MPRHLLKDVASAFNFLSDREVLDGQTIASESLLLVAKEANTPISSRLAPHNPMAVRVIKLFPHKPDVDGFDFDHMSRDELCDWIEAVYAHGRPDLPSVELPKPRLQISTFGRVRGFPVRRAPGEVPVGMWPYGEIPLDKLVLTMHDKAYSDHTNAGGKPTITHKDGDPENCALSNLAWV